MVEVNEIRIKMEEPYESDEDRGTEEWAERRTLPEFAIDAAAQKISSNLLPRISADKYKAIYNAFLEWKTLKKVNDISENLLLIYFDELAKTYAPSTLWAKYSMLRTTVMINHKINIEEYKQVTAFLKKQSVGFKPKKAKVLEAQDINKFFKTAPDHDYLAIKVALIIGISGACRSDELTNLNVNDVSDQGEILIVRMETSKTRHDSRTFTIKPEFYATVKKYILLRPKKTSSSRFFIKYQKGKCYNQVIGKNKFGSMCRDIAEFLQLGEPKRYTSHTFRRSSATLLADAGADIMEMTGPPIKKLKTESPSSNRIYEVQSSSSSASNSNSIQAEKNNKSYSVTHIPEKNITLYFSNCSNININFQ